MNNDLKFASPNVLSATFAVLLALVVSASSEADINMNISENATGVVFAVEGSLDVSAFGTPSINFSQLSQFTRVSNVVNSTGTVDGTQLSSDLFNGDGFAFPNDTSMTPVGSIPAGQVFQTLTVDPLFWYGFGDHTPTTPGTGSFRDNFTLPDGYVSGDILNLSFVESGLTLADLGLVNGDFWGTSFADSAGGTQTMTFSVVPEPSSFTVMIGLAIAGLLARKRQRFLCAR